MRTPGHGIARNAIANTVRGGAGAVVAFFLPPFLTRILDHDHFAAWALLLQIAAYVNFLDFGIQTAVARFVAHSEERGDKAERDGYISAAFFMLAGAALLAFAVVCGIACLIPQLFKQVPFHLLSEMREGLIVLAALSAAALPTSAFTGAFVGLRRNDYPAVIMGATRLLGASLVIIAAHRTQSLVMMAGLIGSVNLLGGLTQFVPLKRMIPDLRLSLSDISRHHVRSLAHFCAGLSVWSFGMFLVGGLDLTIVGYFNFSGVAYYSLASNAVLLVAGLCGAATNALIAPAAAIHANEEYERLGHLAIRATGQMTHLLVAASFPFFLFGTPLLTLWVGKSYSGATIHILQVLLAGNLIRMLGAPYAAIQVGAGEHVRVMFAPLAEGIVNLLASLIAGYYMGPIGVAFGTLIGSIAGIILQISYNVPRLTHIRMARRDLLVNGIVRPFTNFAPALAGLSGAVFLQVLNPALRCLLALVSITLSALLVKQWTRWSRVAEAQ